MDRLHSGGVIPLLSQPLEYTMWFKNLRAFRLPDRLGLDAEAALRQANNKFEYRFTAMDQAARAEGGSLATDSDEQLESRWQQAKKPQ